MKDGINLMIYSGIGGWFIGNNLMQNQRVKN